MPHLQPAPTAEYFCSRATLSATPGDLTAEAYAEAAHARLDRVMLVAQRIVQADYTETDRSPMERQLVTPWRDWHTALEYAGNQQYIRTELRLLTIEQLFEWRKFGQPIDWRTTSFALQARRGNQQSFSAAETRYVLVPHELSTGLPLVFRKPNPETEGQQWQSLVPSGTGWNTMAHHVLAFLDGDEFATEAKNL